MSLSIDLNADLGEGDACDVDLFEVISSCNIACGGHAGDASSMQTTVTGALASDVVIGAHPSYPDRQGFGRLARFLTGEALFESLAEQLRALAEVCARKGARICHVKPHGALYNDAADDPDLAAIIIRSINELPGSQSLVGPPESELSRAAQSAGLAFVSEAFVDRAYLNNGRLVPRSDAAAVHTNLDMMASQAVSIAVERKVQSLDGENIPVVADTLCVHGDTPRAAEAARHVRDALQKKGVRIRAVTR
jgi:UPF0271 protein